MKWLFLLLAFAVLANAQNELHQFNEEDQSPANEFLPVLKSRRGCTRCGSSCVDLQTNAWHCGSCGRDCGNGRACKNGGCYDPNGCDGVIGYARCNGRCIDPRFNESHCGSCNRHCGKGQRCIQKSCKSCPYGHAICSDHNPACVKLGLDHKCANCYHRCKGNTRCINYKCVPIDCADDEIYCKGTQKCVKYQTDPWNCGKCGVKCPTGQICRGGKCRVSAVCDDDEFKCPFDVSVCCNNDQICKKGDGNVGICVCTPGTVPCEDKCVPKSEFLTDPKNCGKCGNVCPGTSECIHGKCVFECNEDEGETLCPHDPNVCCERNTECFLDENNNAKCDCFPPNILCDDKCLSRKDLESDPKNCGECGVKCPKGFSCNGGECRSDCEDSERICPDFKTCCDRHSETCVKEGLRYLCECRPNFEKCNGKCVDKNDFWDDRDNCGKCGHKCDSSEVCIKGTCTSQCEDNQYNCPAGNKLCCNIGELCILNPEGDDWVCKCPSHQIRCGNKCIPIKQLEKDDENCGECGNACPKDHSCKYGSCVCTGKSCENECDENEIECDGKCKKLGKYNCYACGKRCRSGEFCSKVNKKCIPDCKYGDICPEDNGLCCRENEGCQYSRREGKYVCVCSDPFVECDKKCIHKSSLENWDKHCGKCNNKCPSGTKCQNSECVKKCSSSDISCGTTCCDKKTEICEEKWNGFSCRCNDDHLNCKGKCGWFVKKEKFQTDKKNCGKCGNACGYGQDCIDGKCEAKCGTGATKCRDGTCCRKGQTCQKKTGSSGYECVCEKQDEIFCDGKCIKKKYLLKDSKNCGKCGNVCKKGEKCKSGICVCSGSKCGCPTGEFECYGQCVKPSDDQCFACNNKCPENSKCDFKTEQCLCHNKRPLCGETCCNDGQNCVRNQCVDKHATCKDDQFPCPLWGSDDQLCCEHGSEVCTLKKGKFVCACGHRRKRCGDTCINIWDDPENCGECNNKCSKHEGCHKGKCEKREKCDFGEVPCAGDESICCRTDQICVENNQWEWKCKCPHNSVECYGVCRRRSSFLTDNNNCGRCGFKCRDGQHCENGLCKSSGTGNCKPVHVTNNDMKTHVKMSDESNLKDGHLLLVIRSNFVQSSVLVKIIVNEAETSPCGFPGTYWGLHFDRKNCQYVSKMYLPLVTMEEECPLSFSLVNGVYHFKGQAKVVHAISLSKGVVREVITIINFVITLPKNISIKSESLAVTGKPANVDATTYLISKTWIFDANVGRLVYRTEVADSNKSKVLRLNFASVIPPEGLETDVTEIVAQRENCDAYANPAKPCVQFWEALIHIGDKCSFTGHYTYSFDAVCRTGSCAYEEPVVIESEVISDDTICNAFQIDVSVDLEMKTRDDIIVYKHGDRLYIEVTAESQKVKIEDIMPVIISVIIDDNSKILFRHDGPTTLGEQLDFKLDLDLPAGDKKTLKFSFLAKDPLFTYADGADFEVAGSFMLRYQGLGTRRAVLRESMNLNVGDKVALKKAASDLEASCEGFVNPCKTENGGCNTEPYTSCQAVDCNGEVVCQKAVAAETDEVESSMIEENKLYIAAGGGVLFAGVGAMFLMKKKKKY